MVLLPVLLAGSLILGRRSSGGFSSCPNGRTKRGRGSGLSLTRWRGSSSPRSEGRQLLRLEGQKRGKGILLSGGARKGDRPLKAYLQMLFLLFCYGRVPDLHRGAAKVC